MRRGTERVSRSEYISGLSLSEIFIVDAVMPRFLVQMTCAHLQLCNDDAEGDRPSEQE